jgi:hypothetical protein
LTTHDPIALAEGECVHVVIDGRTVCVEHVVDGEGGHAVQLHGVDCDLEGEMPGLYYPVARDAGEWPGALRVAVDAPDDQAHHNH